MLPDPLHPAVVHLPIALMILVPLFALLAAVAIRARLIPPVTWAAVVLLQVALLGSGWMAMETGEQQEERVEQVVAERHIELHEGLAQRFLLAALGGLLVIGAGLLSGSAGDLSRWVAVVAALAVLLVGIQVGHSGGELVYRHGAARAYAPSGSEGAVARLAWQNGIAGQPGLAGEAEDPGFAEEDSDSDSDSDSE